MSKIKKHKKLLYVPGIFSLLVIPLVFYYYANERFEQFSENYLYFTFPPKDYFNYYPEGNYKIGYSYLELVVPPNFSDETENYYFKLIKDLQELNINKSGIKFQLNDNNVYADFIKLANLMELTDQSRYSLDLEDNNFYVVNDNVEDRGNILICGTSFLENESKSSFNLLSEINYFLKSLPKYAYIIIIGYLILVVISLFQPKIFIPISFKK